MPIRICEICSYQYETAFESIIGQCPGCGHDYERKTFSICNVCGYEDKTKSFDANDDKHITTITHNKLRNITSVLIDGLNTDGSHHKQYYLEEALRLLAPGELKDCKLSWNWEDGVRP